MDQYLGEIRLIGFTFAPVGWLMCDGSLQSISNFEALYTLLGNTYGGDGQTTFGLPDLRGRAPIHQSGPSPIGSMGGYESVTLNSLQIPAHTHPIGANSGDSSASSPSGAYFGNSGATNWYQPVGSNLTPTGNMLLPTGGNQPHENRMPFQVLNYIIATEGIYPSQS